MKRLPEVGGLLRFFELEFIEEEGAVVVVLEEFAGFEAENVNETDFRLGSALTVAA